MTPPDEARDTGGGGGPWWASGRTPQEGMAAGEDPLGSHHRARTGGDHRDRAGGGTDDPDDTALGPLAAEALELLLRLAGTAGRRMADRATANATPDEPDGPPSRDAARARWAGGTHGDGDVCDACPVCMALRVVREARPDVVTHLADAAHHVSLALQALADAQGTSGGLEHIDLDP